MITQSDPIWTFEKMVTLYIQYYYYWFFYVSIEIIIAFGQNLYPLELSGLFTYSSFFSNGYFLRISLLTVSYDLYFLFRQFCLFDQHIPFHCHI